VDEMSNNLWDVVVMGGGIAGLTIARHIQELGVERVLIVERGNEGGENNARISGGLIHPAWMDMKDDPEDIYKAIMDITEGTAVPELARAYADTCETAIDWLIDQGVSIDPKNSEVPYMRWATSPHNSGTGKRIDPTRGPDQMMQVLYSNFLSNGGVVEYNSAIIDASFIEGYWEAKVVNQEDSQVNKVKSKTLVLADGGFQANKRLLDQYVGPNASKSVLRSQSSQQGDSLSIALKNGAKVVGMDKIYGHIVSRNAETNDLLWPYPPLDKMSLVSAVINSQGELVEDQFSNGIALCNALAKSAEPMSYYAVFDDSVWEHEAKDNPYGSPVPNPDLVERGGEIFKANSIEELSSQIGIENLKELVEHHNALNDTQNIRKKISSAPYYAVPIAPGITFTMGGILTNDNGQILNNSGEVINQLYAVGSCSGGLDGGPTNGYVGGLASSLVFGLRAAKNIETNIKLAAI
jgi:fumarate reductase flavoprotein subunit